ncbi:sensor histidine kinase [Flavobacterium aciduliphilum]|uniref:histidine kinase n=1 Tax=Flavobacterium aciduliphilum TaxID=1101402 RepID=A0A328YM46_9FLAO|nr:HAMP domain-containing sensor histidine kinase [Flavobacterium aciduliphilum]RAR73915.1 signal transduction histidine kinase [Flavobacterium aciduliphilum]
MNKFSLKNRIAFLYIISAAILIFVVFFSIYSIVLITINKKINENINLEVNEYIENIKISPNKINFINPEAWIQREHNEVSVDPVFLQLTDSIGTIIKKSENLKDQELEFTYKLQKQKASDTKISGKLVRQIQVPLFNEKKIVGYLIVAVSLQEAISIQENLKYILSVIFPIVLLVLFFMAQFIAGRSIKPINTIIETSNTITNDNLKARIPLPKNKDELYVLSHTINSLLNRIEDTLEREKQFTSDASHELRTPLAVIKGTLQVLIRKPRTLEEYNQKINLCIEEVDHINDLVDQLLLLARFENQKQSISKENINVNECLAEAISRYKVKEKNKKIEVQEIFDDVYYVSTDGYLLSIILHNIISNAFKYTPDRGIIKTVIERVEDKIILKIIDNGIGISQDELDKVFNSFYRASNVTEAEHTKGIGLGLSIVRRLCSMLSIQVSIVSEQNKGCTVLLTFNSH